MDEVRQGIPVLAKIQLLHIATEEEGKNITNGQIKLPNLCEGDVLHYMRQLMAI